MKNPAIKKTGKPASKAPVKGYSPTGSAKITNGSARGPQRTEGGTAKAGTSRQASTMRRLSGTVR